MKTSHLPGAGLLGVDRDDDALAAELLRRLAHQFGSATAAELMLHLSVPASSRRRMSSVERMPPPTVSGRKTRAAVRDTTSRMVSRFSWLAVMSRKVQFVRARRRRTARPAPPGRRRRAGRRSSRP